MKKLFLTLAFFIIGLSKSTFAQSAATNTWYGDLNSGKAGFHVKHIRIFNATGSTSAYFQVINDPAWPSIANNDFYFDVTTTLGKNWLSVLESSKSSGQTVEFHTTSAVGSADPAGYYIDVVGLR